MREIKYRGLTKKGEMIYGSLVVTDSFIKHMPKQHTKTWIVTSAFGNGGWFNIRCRQYVLPESVGQFTGLTDDNEVEVFEGDKLMITNEAYNLNGEVMTVEFSRYEDSEGCMDFGHLGWHCGGLPLIDCIKDGSIVVDNIHQPDIEF